MLTPHNARKLARLGLASGVLVLLAGTVGVREIIGSLASLDLGAAALLIAILFVDMLIRADNWRALLLAGGAASGLRVSRRTVWYSYGTGGFFGSALPSSLGLDVARIAVLARHGGVPLAESGAGLVLMTVLSLWTLNLIAAAGAAVWLLAGGPVFLIPVLLASAGAAVVLPALPLVGPQVRERVLPRLPARVRRGIEAMVKASGRRDVLLRVALVTLVNHGLTVACVAVVTHSIATPDSTWPLLVLVPMATVLRLLPLSVSGFGAEQGIFVFLLALIGVRAADAVSISLVLSSANLLISASWGLVYLVHEGARAPATPTEPSDALLAQTPAALAATPGSRR